MFINKVPGPGNAVPVAEKNIIIAPTVLSYIKN